MSRFLQLHLLTSYPPANLNRDDLGRPKTAKMGGTDRLRVSSQSLKRSWKTSELFERALGNHIGTRTKRMGYDAAKKFSENGIKEKDAVLWGKEIASAFADTEGKDKTNAYKETILKQPVHLSRDEYNAVQELVSALLSEKRAPKTEELNLLRENSHCVDIAMFGRMLAVKGKQHFGQEAACQVAHAISVHPVTIEDDYFTAVDDLNDGSEDAGAAHIGETGFAAGLFYSYICINKELLVENLNSDIELANKAIAALTEAAVKVSPQGKQNSFGSRAYASYVLAEKGDQQPRSLSVAFLKPVNKYAEDYATEAVQALEKQRDNFNRVYGDCADVYSSLNAITGEGSLQELLAFVAE
ncbi:type I-E CRISPR-associated protein Cas7/Cse4/CasC [Endozoicomonas numazuensis]|uniref:CRISPR-associated protein Cse4 n=1 Tax=Endozoicomonas numazuensis TaxID=1137799 RepID=A0A081NCR2_9GAMM|nr:type I-E CRISPR-associated protein Cas7/Cse4/CasC [Endozoicomonas numazuensis]KEQ16235.1 CRISPR-associated protein Cse4 [Endozoicomonas numazuensis]